MFSIFLSVCDGELLYPLLGDPIKEDMDEPSKLDLLLRYDGSLIGSFSSQMVDMLESWNVGGPARRPWCATLLHGS